MGDLISRAAAIAEIEEFIEEYSELDPETGYHNLKWCAMKEAKDVLTMLPAVDAVRVVRCGECKYYVTPKSFCYVVQGTPREDFYCAAGKRREADEDNTP